MSIAQVLAVLIFLIMFVLVVSEKVERHIVTLLCGIATLAIVFGVVMKSKEAITCTLNLKSFITLEFWYASGESLESSMGINWATIVFIFGMMIMVEGMAKAGFFRWLCMKLAKFVHYKPIPLFVSFMIMSAVLAMFIDSITVILFLAAVTVELAKLLKFNPIPMILSEIFCANLGGSATMCGDPPNIIIGTSLGYSFFNFLLNTGMIAAVSLIVTVIYYYFVYRKELSHTTDKVDVSSMPSPESAICDRKEFFISCGIFVSAVLLLITHSMTGLTVAFIGVYVSIVTLMAFHKDALHLLKKVDYETLVFFIGLFMVVAGLEYTGILEMIAEFIGVLSGGNVKVMMAMIIWLSAVASAFVDNIPFAATMIPVIKTLAASQGVSLETLAWGLAMGTDIGGSATPIGASANVVGTSVAAKNGYFIDWGTYCKSAVPATIIVMILSTIIIFVRYC